MHVITEIISIHLIITSNHGNSDFESSSFIASTTHNDHIESRTVRAPGLSQVDVKSAEMWRYEALHTSYS